MKTFTGSLSKSVPRPSCRPIVAPVPRPFDFGYAQRHPLAPMSAVTLLLNTPARAVAEFIEDGRLRWAFDIRSHAASKREVRVLWQSLLIFTRLYPESAAVHQGEATEFDGTIKLILPPGVVVTPDKAAGSSTHFKANALPGLAAAKPVMTSHEPVLTGTEVAQCLSCRTQHVHNLIQEKSLQALVFRTGPKASPLITRTSLVNFLRERRMS